MDRIILGEPPILSLRLLWQTFALHGLGDVILKFLCLSLYLSNLHLLTFSLSILAPFFFDLCLLTLLDDLYLCLALSMLNLFDISLYFLVTFLGLRSLENVEIFKVQLDHHVYQILDFVQLVFVHEVEVFHELLRGGGVGHVVHVVIVLV